MTGSVVRGIALAAFMLLQGVRLLLEPAQHASVVTLGVLSVFLAGMFTALTVREIMDDRRGRKQ